MTKKMTDLTWQTGRFMAALWSQGHLTLWSPHAGTITEFH